MSTLEDEEYSEMRIMFQYTQSDSEFDQENKRNLQYSPTARPHTDTSDTVDVHMGKLNDPLTQGMTNPQQHNNPLMMIFIYFHRMAAFMTRQLEPIQACS